MPTTRRHSQGSQHQSRGERHAAMARKREERAVRNAYKKEKKSAEKDTTEEENFLSFRAQLAKMQLQLREIPGDGNCLFRSLGDQLEGHGRCHYKHRQDVVDFMREHRADFEPFVEDDVPFDRHIVNLKKVGTYAGNDAIVAFARLHRVTVVIHQLNSPCLQIHGSDDPNTSRQIHISYHNGDHYGSVRTIGDNSETPAKIKFRDGVPIEKGGQEFHLTNPLTQATYAAGYAADCLSSLPEVGRSAVAKVCRDFNHLVWEVTNTTGCHDSGLVESILKDNNWNVDFANREVLQLMDTGYTTESETSLSLEQDEWSERSDIDVQAANPPVNCATSGHGAKPKQKADSGLVESILKDNNWNVDFANREVLQLMDTGYTTESETSLSLEQDEWSERSDIDVQAANPPVNCATSGHGAKPKQKAVSARDNKLAKKKRAEQRHREELGARNDLTDVTDDFENEATLVTQHVGVLQI